MLEQVYYHLDLIEKDYFGLQFTDSANVNVSLEWYRKEKSETDSLIWNSGLCCVLSHLELFLTNTSEVKTLKIQPRIQTMLYNIHNALEWLDSFELSGSTICSHELKIYFSNQSLHEHLQWLHQWSNKHVDFSVWTYTSYQFVVLYSKLSVSNVCTVCFGTCTHATSSCENIIISVTQLGWGRSLVK